MTTDAITEQDKRVSESPGGPPLQATANVGPSDLRQDEPTLARTLGMIGAALVIFGGMALAFNLYGKTVRVSSGLAIFILAFGLGGLLFHAAFDRDVQFRRMYLAFGAATLLLGIFLAVLPYPKSAGDQFRYAVPCLMLALLFILAFLRNETDEAVRSIAQLVLGGAGGLMALVGLFGGNVRGEFFIPIGLVLSLLGLVYLAAFVGSRKLSDNLAYFTAVALTLAGVLVILVCLGRSLFTPAGSSYFVSYGVLLLFVGLLYSATGAGLASDASVFVLTRRELGSFFFSPMAYLTLLGFVFVSFVCYWMFVSQVLDPDPRNPPIEPIARLYLFALFPVIAVIVIVPVLTMRLLSEEQRSGTLEVLLTAPVNEGALVLSKFLAALITYLVVWAPFGLYLLAIPLSGGNPFDYRPLLSFLVVLVVTGGAFISVGLFFSSLTKSQIASGVLTFSAMLLLTGAYFGAHATQSKVLETVFTHMSYLDVWYTALEGKIIVRFLLFPLSLTVVFLFLTVKVLESRKWR